LVGPALLFVQQSDSSTGSKKWLHAYIFDEKQHSSAHGKQTMNLINKTSYLQLVVVQYKFRNN